jgi:hypothetical protein
LRRQQSAGLECFVIKRVSVWYLEPLREVLLGERQQVASEHFLALLLVVRLVVLSLARWEAYSAD